MNLKTIIFGICGVAVFQFANSMANTIKRKERYATNILGNEYEMCGNGQSVKEDLFLTSDDCAEHFNFNDQDKTCDLKEKDGKVYVEFNIDKDCLYGEEDEDTCHTFRFQQNCNKNTVYALRPYSGCIENPNGQLIAQKVTPTSNFINKEINTKDYFFVAKKTIYNLYLFIYFNVNMKKIELLEKLMQNISKRAKTNYQAIEYFTENCGTDLQIEIQKWCIRKAIEDYYHYTDDFEDNVRKLKFGKKDINNIMKELKNKKSASEFFSLKINLYVESYNDFLRTFEPEMQIYYQEF